MICFSHELQELIQRWLDRGSAPEEIIEDLEHRVELMREGDHG